MVSINAEFMNMIKRTNMYFIDRFGSVNSINTYPRLKFVWNFWITSTEFKIAFSVQNNHFEMCVRFVNSQ